MHTVAAVSSLMIDMKSNSLCNARCRAGAVTSQISRRKSPAPNVRTRARFPTGRFAARGGDSGGSQYWVQGRDISVAAPVRAAYRCGPVSPFGRASSRPAGERARARLMKFDADRLLSRRRCLMGVAAFLLAASTAGSARAETQADLALVLAVDASGSVDQQRFELQKRGYVAAFRNPRVLQAIRSGLSQAIAVTMLQWTGPRLQIQVVPWMLIRDEASAEAFAAAIEAAPRQLFGGGTSISGAIDHSRLLLAQNPFGTVRRVIDVSGDGSNNSGRPVTSARDDAARAGVSVNGLPILSVEPDLDGYYRDFVIGGPGAFMVPAASYDTFAEAILKKLITEIAARESRPPRGRRAERKAS